MDSHEMYMLSSHHQAFSAEGEAFCGSSSRILQNSSGNLGLKATSVLESDDDDGRDTKEAPSIFEGPQRKSHYKHVSRQPAERLHRRRLYPWELDRNFIRYENQSERYRQYRDKARQNNEQKWPDDVEDALQHGKTLAKALYEVILDVDLS